MRLFIRFKIIFISLLFPFVLPPPVMAIAQNSHWQGRQINPSAGEALYQILLAILNADHVFPKGRIGISAINLKSGQMFSINGDASFFMASTYKVPIAMQLLTLVDKKNLSLNKMETIGAHDIVPGSGIIIDYFNNTTITLSVKSLLTLMMQESDNTATDRLLELAGGPLAVTDHLRTLGITNMSVDRSTLEFASDYFNVSLPPWPKRSLASLMALFKNAPPPNLEKFLSDKRDNTSPNAMTELLGRLYQSNALSTASRDLLLEIMSKEKAETGRIFYYVPGALIAQKLGTGMAVVNDVGLLQLPMHKGTIAIAIYMDHVAADEVIDNKVSALIAKTVYDFFTFN